MNSIFNNVFLGGALLTFFNYFSTLLTPLTLMILKFFNIGYYIIKNDEKRINEIIKILEKTTISTITLYEFGKNRPLGIFVGWKYIGVYNDAPSDYSSRKELYMITFDYILKKLINDDNDENNSKKVSDHVILNIDQYIPLKKNNNKKITIYERAGTYLRLYYEKRIFDISKFCPTDKQSPIIESIINIYNKKNNASVFISGDAGSGKSMIGFLLAKELNAKLVRTFNPIEPGDNMISMIREIEPTDENPLIIMMDEADILINKITENKIVQHKNIPIMIYDKITFNRFMDDMMFYDNVILILTSNQSKQSIDSLDSSFLRSGRID